MTKKFLIPIIIVGIIILILLGSWLMWYFKAERSLNVYILDKTVPTMERTEHKSFNWVLNHNRYVKPNGDLYNVDKDYYGFFPLTANRRNLILEVFVFTKLRMLPIHTI